MADLAAALAANLKPASEAMDDLRAIADALAGPWREADIVRGESAPMRRLSFD